MFEVNNTYLMLEYGSLICILLYSQQKVSSLLLINQ